MSTDTGRYTIVQAARKARMGHETLARAIKAGQVPGCCYIAPEPQGRHGVWWIPAAHFDAWLGIAPKPEPMPFLRKLRAS